MKPASLRLKILLITTALVVGVVASVLGILNSIVNSQIQATSHRVSQRTSETLKRSIVESQLNLLNVATLLADRPGTKTIYQTDSKTINDHLNETLTRVKIDWLVLTDSSGIVIGASSKAPYPVGADLHAVSAVSSSLQGKSWSGTLQARNSISLAAAVPILIGGYVQSILIPGTKVDKGLLSRISNESDAQLSIAKGGAVLASTIRESFKVRLNPGMQSYSLGGEVFLGELQTFPGAQDQDDLGFLVLTPQSSVTGQYLPLRNGLYYLLLLGLAVALVAGATLSRSLTRPLDVLVASAEVVRNGQWPDALPVTRKDEIGLLQSAFNEMLESVRANHERLSALLEIDPLTQLVNYRNFRDRLDVMLQMANDRHQSIGLLLIDLDAFDAYNRVHGGVAGDAVLVEAADIIQGLAGTDALCARYGGNEFAIVHQDQELEALAEQLRESIERSTPVTASIGVVSVDEGTNRVDLLLLAAEVTVSQAKAGGRNRVRKFEGFEIKGNDAELGRYLENASYGAVRALAEAVDAKDEYTRGHSQRVAEYARDLAKACGYDQGFVDLVYLTGTLHDVGKIGVPDSALKKPGKLTDEEFAMVKMHPELGEKIVRQIPQLKDTLPGIRNHHERYDGRGYPDGLSGDEIPLIARILAVADTYDAMTSNRPYRQGLPHWVAMAEIEKGSSSQFDPELVRVFMSNWAGEADLAA